MSLLLSLATSHRCFTNKPLPQNRRLLQVSSAVVREAVILTTYKIITNNMIYSGEAMEVTMANGQSEVVTFRNLLCAHLRYECDRMQMRFSLWRGALQLLQLFQVGRCT